MNNTSKKTDLLQDLITHLLTSRSRYLPLAIQATILTTVFAAPVAHAVPGDADNDGISDVVEADADANNDGLVDSAYVATQFMYEDFGTGTTRSPSPYTNYVFNGTDRIFDGEYAITYPNASLGFWMWFDGGIAEDHTPGDVDGRYFAVNGDFAPGEFYRRVIPGITAGGTYFFSGWAIDTQHTTTNNPNIRFEVRDTADVILDTLDLDVSLEGTWTEGKLLFKSEDGADISLIMRNNAPGGDGNDLAIDDIRFDVIYPDSDADGIANQFGCRYRW